MFRPGGYTTNQGFIGFMPDGSRMFFPTSDEYYDYIEELIESAAPMSA
jgi:hypothetical protein